MFKTQEKRRLGVKKHRVCTVVLDECATVDIERHREILSFVPRLHLKPNRAQPFGTFRSFLSNETLSAGIVFPVYMAACDLAGVGIRGFFLIQLRTLWGFRRNSEMGLTTKQLFMEEHQSYMASPRRKPPSKVLNVACDGWKVWMLVPTYARKDLSKLVNVSSPIVRNLFSTSIFEL